jgi:very-short-patch-repair endonuclease
MDPNIERAIAERARQQLGHITTPQLRELGLSSAAVRRMVDRGRLVPVGRRTFRLGGVPPSFDGRVMAACLDLDGVASNRTAAFLHGLATRPWTPVPIEVTVPKRTGQTHSPLARVHTSTNLQRDDIIAVRGIPTTSVARTIFSLAAMVPELEEEHVRDLLDVALRDGRASEQWLWWMLERLRCRGRNGVSVLEEMLADRAGRGRTESWLERAFLACLEEGGLPLPIVQRRIKRRGAFVARVDFLYEPTLVLEVSGYATHSSRAEVARDVERRNRLLLAGYSFLEFTHDHVVKGPGKVRADVTEALALMRAWI